MVKETKQDVFEEVVKDCEEFGIYFSDENQVGRVDGRTVDQVSKDYRNRYAAASPCKLPVIPQTVGEYIKWGKIFGIPTYMMFSFKFVRGQGFSKLTDEVEDWIISNSDAFATAWLLGDWEVEDGCSD